MTDSSSPEERLFNVIKENRENNAPVSSGQAAQPAAAQPAGSPSAGISFRERFMFPLVSRIRRLNSFFGVIVGVLAFLLCVYAASPAGSVHRIARSVPVAQQEGSSLRPADQSGALKPAEFYESQIHQRNVFLPFQKGLLASESAMGGKDFSDFAGHLVLTGIYRGESPEVMIEDTAQKKTFFLKQGDDLKGIKVKAILEDRVILEYGGAEKELF